MSLHQSIQQYRNESINKFELASQIQTYGHMLDDLCQCLCRSGNSCSLSAEGITASITISEIGDVKFSVDPVDQFSFSAWAMLLGSAYIEKDILTLFQHLAGPEAVVFDIGANIGWYSIISAKLGASVYAFEPIPRTFHFLEKNVALNHFEHAIHTFNIGCADQAGEAVFYFDERASGSASRQDLNYLQDNQSQQICVTQTRLDDFVQEQGMQRVDLVKCDVEGGELFVFQGGKVLLQKFRPFVICEMLRKHAAKFGYYPDRTIELFSELDYVCLALDKEHSRSGRVITHMSNDSVETNFLFVPREKLSSAQEWINIKE